AEAVAARLGAEEWLVVDGLLSESAKLAGHPRALGVIKSHSAQYFEGADVLTALTCPAGARTSVFRPRGRARHEVYSWYLRLWPWEGNDLLFGLLRIEARAHADTVAAELKPATPHQFHFWTAQGTSIGIGAIVRVEEQGKGNGEGGRVVYGVVTDAFAYSDLATPLHDVIGAEGDPVRAAAAPTVRQ